MSELAQGDHSTLRKFVTMSTFLGLFSAGADFGLGGVHILIFYFLALLNLALIASEGKLWFPRGLLWLFGFMALSGGIGILQGTDTVPNILKSLLGIVLNATYFCAFLRYVRFDVDYCFRMYAKFAFYVAALGLLAYPVLYLQLPMYRLKSVFQEPGEFAIVCAPAAIYYLDQWQRKRTGGWQFLLLVLTLILANSSIGYLGLLFGFYMFGTRYRFGKLLAPVLVVGIGVAIYTLSADFRLRAVDTVTGLATGNASDTNLSSFALISGAYVAEQVILDKPFFGWGLGSISLSHERYVGNLPGVEEFIEGGILQISRGDGGSMLLRLLAETGLIGTALALGFVFACYPYHATPEVRAIAISIATYIFVKMLRSGVYFNPEEFFFLVIYAVIGAPSLVRARRLAQVQSPVLSLETGTLHNAN